MDLLFAYVAKLASQGLALKQSSKAVAPSRSRLRSTLALPRKAYVLY
jgi:lambda repressor-like predicted transcriptional regulator